MSFTHCNFNQYVNVSCEDVGVSGIYTYELMQEVVLNLIPLRPTWKFRFESLRQHNNSTHVFNTVVISDDTGKLGHLRHEYGYVDGRRTPKLEIYNHRIARDQERRTYKTTASGQKAVAIVRKYFAPLSRVEIIESAVKRASEAIRDVAWGSERSLRDLRSTISVATFDFVMSGGGDFHKYLVDKRLTEVEGQMRKYEETEVCYQAARMLNDHFNKSNCMVIVKIDSPEGKYLVRQADDSVQYMNDDTFPEEYRSGLGMLKLVEDGQLVTEVGMRVNSDVFVLVRKDV